MDQVFIEIPIVTNSEWKQLFNSVIFSIYSVNAHSLSCNPFQWYSQFREHNYLQGQSIEKVVLQMLNVNQHLLFFLTHTLNGHFIRHNIQLCCVTTKANRLLPL